MWRRRAVIAQVKILWRLDFVEPIQDDGRLIFKALGDQELNQTSSDQCHRFWKYPQILVIQFEFFSRQNMSHIENRTKCFVARRNFIKDFLDWYIFMTAEHYTS